VALDVEGAHPERGAGAGNRSASQRQSSVQALSATAVKSRAEGRWSEVVSALVGFKLDDRHHHCPLPGHPDAHPSWRWDSGKERWFCTCGQGDALDLVQAIEGIDFRGAIERAVGILRLDGVSHDKADPEDLGEMIGDQPPAQEKRKAKAPAWQRIWDGAIDLDAPAAIPVRAYLEARGLKVPDTASLRCVLDLPYFRDKRHEVGRFPALVALVVSGQGEPWGVQRVYLSADGTGKASLPEGLDAKKALGRLRGGAVRLDEPRNSEPLVIAEGVETALAVREATGWPTWSTVSAPGIKAVRVSEGVTRVYVAADLDRSGAGEKAAHVLAARLHSAGMTVHVVTPAGPIPQAAKSVDWLDVFHNDGPKVVQAAFEESRRWEMVRPTLSMVEAARSPSFVSLGDLLAAPDEETSWLVDGILPVGGVSVLCGKPKAGKSTLAHGLALAVALGESWLGCPTARGKVCYLALEEKPAELVRHFRLMGAPETRAIRLFMDSIPRDAMDWLRRSVEEEKPALVIVDTLQRLVRARDLNDYAGVTSALDPILRLARQSGVHLMLLHHAGKGLREGIDTPLGSTSIAGTADTILFLKRSRQHRTLSSQQRYGVDLEEVIIDLDDRRRPVVAGSHKECERKRVRVEILRTLQSEPEPLSREEIEREVEGATAVLRGALKELVDGGEITRAGRGRRGDPFLYSPRTEEKSPTVASCFPVLDIDGEQENGKPELEAPPDNVGPGRGADV
jgi:putative DNA primase/helicase